jgi:hypothetical protein
LNNYADDDEKFFVDHMPVANHAFMVLKGHLLIERRLHEFIFIRLNKDLAAKVIGERGEMRQGKKLILLAQCLAERDDIPHSANSISWNGLLQLNTLRNYLLHNLTPNEDKTVDLICNFADTVFENTVDIERKKNIAKIFWHALRYVNMQLTMHRNEAVPSDFE